MEHEPAAEPKPPAATAPVSANARLMFYVEIYKLNREEVRELGVLWVYILIGVGAGFLTSVKIDPQGLAAIGLTGCFVVFAFFYVVRIIYCYSSMIGTSREIRARGLLEPEELRRLEMLPRQLWLMGLLLAIIPVLAFILVMALVALR